MSIRSSVLVALMTLAVSIVPASAQSLVRYGVAHSALPSGEPIIRSVNKPATSHETWQVVEGGFTGCSSTGCAYVIVEGVGRPRGTMRTLGRGMVGTFVPSDCHGAHCSDASVTISHAGQYIKVSSRGAELPELLKYAMHLERV